MKRTGSRKMSTADVLSEVQGSRAGSKASDKSIASLPTAIAREEALPATGYRAKLQTFAHIPVPSSPIARSSVQTFATPTRMAHASISQKAKMGEDNPASCPMETATVQATPPQRGRKQPLLKVPQAPAPSPREESTLRVPCTTGATFRPQAARALQELGQVCTMLDTDDRSDIFTCREDQFTDDNVSSEEERCVRPRNRDVSAADHQESSNVGVHFWREACRDTGVCESSRDAQQMVLGHMWQVQKKLYESQKESASTMQELKVSFVAKSRARGQVMKASPYVAGLVRRGYKHFLQNDVPPWNINEDSLGGSNRSMISKIMDYVKSAHPETSSEEVNAAIKVYWRNIRRKKLEEGTWSQRLLEARRTKNKRDKCNRRLQSVEKAGFPEEEKERFQSALLTLPIAVTQSSEESGEEDNPFNVGEKIKVKFVRRRRWESQAFTKMKKICDQIHRAKNTRTVQRLNGAFSHTPKPHVLPEFEWIAEEVDVGTHR